MTLVNCTVMCRTSKHSVNLSWSIMSIGSPELAIYTLLEFYENKFLLKHILLNCVWMKIVALLLNFRLPISIVQLKCTRPET